MTSISGSFRVSPRECGVATFLRYRRGMNIAAIATVLKRSVATVERVLKSSGLPAIDNRGQTTAAEARRSGSFSKSLPLLRAQAKIYMAGIITTILEAFDDPATVRFLCECWGLDADALPH